MNPKQYPLLKVKSCCANAFGSFAHDLELVYPISLNFHACLIIFRFFSSTTVHYL
jgi:hypothetical protein